MLVCVCLFVCMCVLVCVGLAGVCVQVGHRLPPHGTPHLPQQAKFLFHFPLSHDPSIRPFLPPSPPNPLSFIRFLSLSTFPFSS